MDLQIYCAQSELLTTIQVCLVLPSWGIKSKYVCAYVCVCVCVCGVQIRQSGSNGSLIYLHWYLCVSVFVYRTVYLCVCVYANVSWWWWEGD